jgi:deoxyribonuclease V
VDSLRLTGPWPATAASLVELQHELALARPIPWSPADRQIVIAATFMCFSGPEGSSERAWAAAVAMSGRRSVEEVLIGGAAGAPYEPGLLALREGPLLAAALTALAAEPDVLLVNATGRDHPRGAGLALHLGAALGVPTVGVTDRPLAAEGPPSAGPRGTSAPLELNGEIVAHRLVTRPWARPVVAHAAWRTSPEVAMQVVLRATRRARTPEPLRRARRLARLGRAGIVDASTSLRGNLGLE